ncbi:extracellular solute-binding protein family 5 [Coraliomargarita akajimensis DSM 45221]|uniref:Extracellular solute-binding protein family 5 n=2 Tax=Coraliomargarita TaxID=442430 RepID=D5EIG1_CORAD|nr:extracellular solute-binding protein family 5 [Coraliomargarita akajimensis DSM 45221]
MLWMLWLTGCGEAPEIVRGQYPLPAGAAIIDAEPGEYGGIFVLNETSQPTTFNPQVPNNLSTSMILGRLLSSLVDFDPRTETFIPALAEGWTVSDDKLSYTFTLREGLLWSDGQPITADDVVFTFDCILADEIDPKTGNATPRYPSRYYEQYHINGEKLRYTKLDSRTIRFDLPTVYAPFIYDISQPILPKHVLGESFEDGSFLKQWTTQVAIEDPGALVASGPFVVNSYRPGERLVLTPNPHFWKADRAGQRLPYVDYLIYKFVSDSNTSIAHFATGKSDASGIGADDYEWVKQAVDTYDFTIHERGPSASVNFFWFNQHRGANEDGEPYVSAHKLRWFTDKRFRQAVQYGLNRQGLIDALLFGKGEPLTSIIPPAQGKWHNPNLPRYDFDPEKSRELLRESGFSWRDDGQLIDVEGIPVEFELLLVESPFFDKIGVTFVENMKELGMQVVILRADFATLLARTDSTFDYDITILGWGSSSAAYDPSGSKALYLSSGVYHQWYPEQSEPATEWEARIDELIGLQERTLDIEKRYEMMHEVQAILAEELPLLYCFTPYGYVGIKDKWHNVYVPKAGTTLWNLEELWTEQGEDD